MKLPERSPLYISFFGFAFRWYVGRNFHALRLSRAGRFAAPPPGPLIVVLNHPSWWDPAVCTVLAEEIFPGRPAYVPIDAAMLEQYRMFAKMGYFGIEPRGARGAMTFLRTAEAVLQNPDHMLWLTAQGRFTDPRERPPGLRPGIGHLAGRLGRGHVLPLAIEYPFWNERFPEALVRFGEPIPLAGTDLTPGRGGSVGGQPIPLAGTDRSARDWTAAIEDALAQTQDALAGQAMRRDPAEFDTLVGGRVGVGGVYDLWRRLRAGFSGRVFRPGHMPEPPPQPPVPAAAEAKP
jgi:1-acyl-sn-glycerol-3-phosphate acyltransferase